MKRTISFLSALAILLPIISTAQVQNEGLANGIIAARRKDAGMLKQYTWNSRTEILEDGKVQDIQIDLVNLGPDGQPQKSLLNDQPGSLPGGFFRKAMEENKRKQLEKSIRDLSKLLDQYTLPSAGGVINFLAGAQVQPITTPDGKTLLQVNGSNVVVPGDSFAMSVDGRSLLPTGVQITTTNGDGDPVTLSASFITMTNGLNHLQFATVTVPSKNVTVMIQNYDYVSND